MGPAPDGDEETFGRHYQFVSAASLWLAWYEMAALWPLDREERKEFRKNYLLKFAAIVDDTLRSGPFLEMLRRFFNPHPEDRATARPSDEKREAANSDSRVNQAMDDAYQELLRILQEKGGSDRGNPDGGRLMDSHQPTSEGPKPAPREHSGRATEGDRLASRASDGRPVANGSMVAQNGEASERLVWELQETNKQLRELLAMQRQLLEQAVADKRTSNGESRNGSI